MIDALGDPSPCCCSAAPARSRSAVARAWTDAEPVVTAGRPPGRTPRRGRGRARAPTASRSTWSTSTPRTPRRHPAPGRAGGGRRATSTSRSSRSACSATRRRPGPTMPPPSAWPRSTTRPRSASGSACRSRRQAAGTRLDRGPLVGRRGAGPPVQLRLRRPPRPGMDGFYLGLGEALREYGGHVLVVRPGFVHTRMTAGREAAPMSVTRRAGRRRGGPRGGGPLRPGLGAGPDAGRDVGAPARAAAGVPPAADLSGASVPVPTRLRHLPTLWAVALALVLLGPALGAGYVLSYDMVWVPHLALRSDFLGFSTALPRAVPSDAVVAVLDDVVPAMLLQKAALLGSLVAAGLGVRPAGRRLAGRAADRGDPHSLEPFHRRAAPDRALDGPRGLRRAAVARARGPGDASYRTGAGRRLGAGPARQPERLGRTGLGAGSRGQRMALAACDRAQRPGAADVRTRRQRALGRRRAAPRHQRHRSRRVGLRPASARAGFPRRWPALGLGGIWNADVVPGLPAPRSWPGCRCCSCSPWPRSAPAPGAGAPAASRPGCYPVGPRLPGRAGYLAVPGSVDWLAEHVPGGGLLRDGTRDLRRSASRCTPGCRPQARSG